MRDNTHLLFRLPGYMNGRVKCVCGAEIDVSGAIPRKDGVKVYCKICGTVTTHQL